MEITDVRAVELQGTIPVDEPEEFWEERVSRPVDIHDEFLVKWNRINQYFLVDPVVLEDGTLPAPTEPGIGVAIDEAKSGIANRDSTELSC